VRGALPLLAVAALLAPPSCASYQKMTDRVSRYNEYAAAVAQLPQPTTRAELYAALPPLVKPKRPTVATDMGTGAFGKETYPLDDDWAVEVSFIYWHRALANPMDLFSAGVVQSDDDTVYNGKPEIIARTDLHDVQAGDLRAVPGKPGFYTVPGTGGQLDCRGYAPGTEIKDPATGKIWKIPTPQRR